ncbi:hypothetical protein EDB84DRAFT_1497435 [Lactarius hengduanensis]|nr:hypothetical protein EDB84DRAFT_1497435 [Lactarius hengduanensis]
MDASSHKLLENVVLKTLHAHSFTRSSSQASLVLSDLLSRYIVLLATTCSQYAQHAGRFNLTVRDAMSALDELGVSMDELHEYCGTEGDELARYSGHSAKRQEDLSEFKASLAAGLPAMRESIPLVWAPLQESYLEDVEEEEEDEQEEGDEDGDVEMVDVTVTEDDSEVPVPPVPQDVGGRPLTPARPPSTPPLPLSPVSNPTSPARKRPRTESWKPPPHIPSFLPPFPAERSSPEPDFLSLPPPGEPSSSSTQLLPSRVEPTAPLARVSSTNPADYTTIVPYSLSNLASTPEWHLPSTLRESRMMTDATPAQFPIPQIQPSLLGAYHHILTHPPPANPNVANPSRHRVAMVLLGQAEKNSHWEHADSLYATVAPNAPTVAPVGPSYAIPLSAPAAAEEKDKDGKKEDERDRKSNLPGAAPRPIGTQERIVPLVSHQTSRIPELAREALSGAVLSRITRLSHPSVLQRGPEKLTYGPGVPAPWNSDRSSAPIPAPSVAKGKELANGLPNGKGKEGEKEPVLPDARLFATWEHDQKSFRESLTVPRRARQGSVHTSLSSNVPGRARGESRAG